MARVRLATVLSKTDHLPQALKEAQKAVELDPDLETAKAELKRISTELKR